MFCGIVVSDFFLFVWSDITFFKIYFYVSLIYLYKMSQASDNENERELVMNPLEKVLPYLPKYIIKDQCYEMKIKNIYDPSKFWIVLKYKELIIFMKYLKDFYENTESRIIIPRNKLKSGLLCMVNRNNMYYRAVVLPILLPDENRIRVFVIDVGLIVNVCINGIFYIFKKHAEVPRFAIRASLADISPLDQSKTWSQSDLKEFCALVDEKKLIAKVCEIDPERSILYVDVRILSGKMYESINSTLVQMGIAAYSEIRNTKGTKTLTKYKARVKYLHLFPTFEALEGGMAPCSLWEHDLLKNSVPLDLLYKNYYEYQDISNSVKPIL